MSRLNVVILAAGKGTRMYSELPKVLHTLAGTPLLQHVLNTASALDAQAVQVVVGHEADQIRKAFAGQKVDFVLQEQQLGTGHAVQQALPAMDPGTTALILFGDVPLVRVQTLQKLLAAVDENSMAVLTCRVTDPTGLGRIIRDEGGRISSIVEEKDASPEQKAIHEINTGIMAIPVHKLADWLPRLQNTNAQKEFYLTDIISLALADNCQVNTETCKNEQEVSGINNRAQLADLERYFQQKTARDLLHAGLMVRDPARFDLRGTLEHGRDVELDVNVVLEGRVILGDRVRIGPNCVLKNCTLGEGTEVAANCVIEEAETGKDCRIGPFARIRPGTIMEHKARVGNFVEIKNTRLGVSSKVNHLSYLGDSVLGSEVNVGAGTITCNYDGVNKHRTSIGNEVFIGSNSVLVAPVDIADGAFIAAGSVITEQVGSTELAIARSRQVNKPDWQRPKKK